MDDFWELLSDKGVLHTLADSSLSEEQLRLILAEVIFRLQAVESQCLALQSFLVNSDLIDPEELQELLRQGSEYLRQKDTAKAKEGEIIATTGITPLEWMNFTYQGRFHQ